MVVASEDISLYSASIPVLSQSFDERTEAAKEGFRQVLIKLTGNSSIIEKNLVLQKELQRAAYYLQEYNYQLASISASQHTLNLHFNEKDIDYLLMKEQIPVWRGKRPVILLWLFFKDKGPSQVISDDSSLPVLPEITNAAREHGLPLVLPLMDTQELSSLSEINLSNFSLATFESLSTRYAYDVILIGQIIRIEKNWQSKWILINQKNVIEWQQTSKDENTLIATLFNEIGSYFFKQSNMPMARK